MRVKGVIEIVLRALVFWLSLLELLAGARGWWGLSWLGRSAGRRLLWLLPLAALRGLPARRSWALLGVLAALPAALWVQITASNRRNPLLNPLLRLRPGAYERYHVTRLDIPMRAGHLPALHITPTRGTSAAVCVAHGSGCDKTSYIWRMVDELVARGVAVLLIDLDGHGENPRPQRFPEITEDIDVAVGWLRGQYARVGVLGISLGGCIAARTVADGLDVDALAVLEAPPQLHYTQRDVYREAAALVRPNLLHLFDECTVQHMIGAWTTTPIRAQIGTHDLIARLDVLGSLPRIQTPLLLLYGGSDAIVKPHQAEQVRRAAPPGAVYRLVPWASHLTLVLTPAALRMVGAWAAQLAEATEQPVQTSDVEEAHDRG